MGIRIVRSSSGEFLGRLSRYLTRAQNAAAGDVVIRVVAGYYSLTNAVLWSLHCSECNNVEEIGMIAPQFSPSGTELCPAAEHFW